MGPPRPLKKLTKNGEVRYKSCFIAPSSVVCADFSIGGYGMGADVRLGLLQREDRGYMEPVEVGVRNRALLLYPVSFQRELRS